MVERPAPRVERLVWTVAGLLHAVSDALAARFAACTVRGEISGFSRAASGHCYFSLKDADGAPGLVRCAMFRRAASLIDFAPGEGQLVEVRGRLAVYEPRGELQFVVESMQRAGEGALFEQFLRLKAKLEAEGLFDPSLKRELPRFPRRVGVVTSRDAAALRDVLTALARRAPHVEVVVYPSLVQGPEAPPALVEAIALAQRRREVDVLIVCRGGGSLQDLWAFNDERVVRAVAHCKLPVICGVGHETDITLCDFAADLRAPTPTAAAELAAPTRDAQLEALALLHRRLAHRIELALDTQAQRLDRAALRLGRPAQRLLRHGQQLDDLQRRLQTALARTVDARGQRPGQLAGRLQRAMGHALALHTHRLGTIDARLRGLDPHQVLARGYAWIADEQGHPVGSVTRLVPEQTVRAVLADGEARARIVEVIAPIPPAA
jgi:exodeoxyribonuclease VII large subunit